MDDNPFFSETESKYPAGLLNVLSSHNDPSEYMGKSYTPYSKKRSHSDEKKPKAEDEVLISEAAKKAYEGEQGGAPSPTPATPTPHFSYPEHLSAVVQTMRERFQETLSLALVASGVDQNEALWLMLDGLGGLQVARPHKDSKNVLDLFASNPSLIRDFKALLALAGLRHQLTELRPFWDLYQTDVGKAFQGFSFQPSPAHFASPVLRFQNGHLEFSFPALYTKTA